MVFFCSLKRRLALLPTAAGRRRWCGTDHNNKNTTNGGDDDLKRRIALLEDQAKEFDKTASFLSVTSAMITLLWLKTDRLEKKSMR